MARTIVVIGNDGSGKTTYVEKYLAGLRRAKIPVRKHAYYSSVVRSKMRGAAERLTGASKKKLAAAKPSTSTSSGAKPATLEPRRAPSRSKVFALYVFLWCYQIGMAIESRWRDWTTRGVLLQDRSFVDDLASILEVFGLETPRMLVRFSVHAFPLRRVIYLSAGHEVEFSRIVELDLSKEMHRRKSERYEEMVRILEQEGAPVKRVSTAPREPLQHDDSRSP